MVFGIRFVGEIFGFVMVFRDASRQRPAVSNDSRNRQVDLLTQKRTYISVVNCRLTVEHYRPDTFSRRHPTIFFRICVIIRSSRASFVCGYILTRGRNKLLFNVIK